MAVSCQTVISLVEKYAPKRLALEQDNIGLQLGQPAQQVEKLFLSLDLKSEVLNEAVAFNADMLVVHHTPFFKPLKHLRSDLPTGKLISEIIRNDMALYTAHTNLDAAWGGVSDILAQKLNLQDVRTLSDSRQQKLYKLVVFIPREYTQRVHEAICSAGAGWIGNYSDCSFRLDGMGTFRPLAGAQPFIGHEGELEQVGETRLETIVPDEKISGVIKAMLHAHPYEEVAYDLYPLANEGKTAGLGRIGRLPHALTLAEFIAVVKEKLAVSSLRYCGDIHKQIEKVAVCGGSGAAYIAQAAFFGAHVFLTADVKYHEAQDALAANLALVDAGHFATEQPVISVLADFLHAELVEKGVEVAVSQSCTDPFCFDKG